MLKAYAAAVRAKEMVEEWFGSLGDDTVTVESHTSAPAGDEGKVQLKR